jgi:hypothetical protein
MSLEISYVVKGLAHQYFSSLAAVLAKAKAHATQTGASEQAFLEARLYPDMYPTIWQVQMASEFCARCASRLVGNELPSFPFEEKNFDELIARLDHIMAHKYLGKINCVFVIAS